MLLVDYIKNYKRGYIHKQTTGCLQSFSVKAEGTEREREENLKKERERKRH